jgi:hypothetical protein
MSLFSKVLLSNVIENYKDISVSFFIEDLIESNSVNLLVGSSNTGKTWITNLLTVCVADNKRFLDHKVDGGNVMICDSEMTLLSLRNRMIKLGIVNSENICIVHNYFPDVTDNKAKDHFITEVKNSNLKLLIIDSLNACSGYLDENSNNDMKIFMDYINELKEYTTVLLIHHTGKSESSSEYRGASVIKARCDNFFLVEKKGRIKVVKSRNLDKTGKIIEFDFHNDDKVEFVVKTDNYTYSQPKKTLSETILLNLEDGMNQTRLFEKMRSNGVNFNDHEARKYLRSLKEIETKKGLKNTSFYYHKS